MNYSICKILLRNKNSFIINASIAIVGIYAGYLLWYIAGFYWNFSISVLFCAFLAAYCLPDWLCTNRYVKDLLYYPVSVQTILFTLLMRMFVMQLCICVLLSYPQFLFGESSRLFTLQAVSACMSAACAIDFIVILFCVLTSSIFPARIVGYVFIIFRYAFFLFLIVITARMTAFGFMHSNFLLWAESRMNFAELFLCMIPLVAMLGIIVTVVFKCRYARGYFNMQSFQKQAVLRQTLTARIENPYFLMEWQRLLWNKELVFFSSIKNIVTVLVLYRLLVRNFEQIVLGAEYAAELFLFAACCGTNTISCTAYSSDPNRTYYVFLPVSARRIFIWKTLAGFIWGEILVIVFGAFIIFTRGIPGLEACLLFLYGTFMNYACSWLGVFLDFKMPRTACSANELMHGNISRVIVLMASAAVTAEEVYLVKSKIVSAALIPFAVALTIFIIVVEICCLLFCKGGFYDTDP